MASVLAHHTLVRKYERQIFRIAQHITQNREDAEDVMQDAFLKAYEKLDQFQGNSKFYTWLVRIAVNESLMRLRKRRTGKMVSIDDEIQTEEGSVPRDFADWAPDPEQNYNQAELADILRKTIQGLPPGFRVVFVLRDVEGLSTEETAETLGLSIPAVKSRLLRARLQLRERLSRYFRRKRAQGKGLKSDLHRVSRPSRRPDRRLGDRRDARRTANSPARLRTLRGHPQHHPQDHRDLPLSRDLRFPAGLRERLHAAIMARCKKGC